MKMWLVLLLALLAFPVTGLAAAPPAGAFPAGSHILASVSLAGGEQAVLYTAGTPFIGLTRSGARGPVLAWHRRLPFQGSKLFTPGSHNSFAGIGRKANTGEFFAFRLAHGKVTPAISGSTTGILTAGEGAHTSHGDVLLRVHDAGHQGSISYSDVTRYHWQSTTYAPIATTLRPDYPAEQLPHPRGLIKTKHGDTILIRLQVADTEQKRESGLMNITSLDPDSGMVFVWPGPVLESFWMENTYVPLTVAFLAADGTIQEMQDMQPLTTDLHTPKQLYQYAIEANLGYFARYGIQVGDRVTLQLS